MGVFPSHGCQVLALRGFSECWGFAVLLVGYLPYTIKYVQATLVIW